MASKGETLKILLVQTANMNLGDTVIADCNHYLIRKAVAPRKCDILRYNLLSRDVSQIQYVDAVVFAAGILKSTSEKIWLHFPEILEEANKHQVPAFLSGIGVEAFHPEDPRSVRLKEAVNLPCVKGISVRDDIETLRRAYRTNPAIPVFPAFDVATWCKDTYKELLAKPNPFAEQGDVIGLGIVRKRLFADYGHPEIDEDYQLDFWESVIRELDSRKLRWKLFTNGDANDELFAKEVLDRVGQGEKLPAPLDADQLVQMVASFRGIIAGRMHANIIAYALGIPSIGFVWNQKLRFWGERIGHPERFLSCEDLTAANAVGALLRAMGQKTRVKAFARRSIYRPLKSFVKKWCRVREKPTKSLPYGETMLALSLGSIDLRYPNTNSPEALSYAAGHGYRNFQVDLRLTADGVPVCVNRWHKGTFQRMNRPVAPEAETKPLSFREFAESQYYHRFHTMTLAEFLSRAARLEEAGQLSKIVLAVGRPSLANFGKILEQLETLLRQTPIDKSHFLLRLEQKKTIEYLKKANVGIPAVYYLVDDRREYGATMALCKAALQYCKEKNIGYFAINHNLFPDAVPALCDAFSIRFCSFTEAPAETRIRYIEQGAYLVGSSCYDVDYMERLTR